MEIEPPDKAPDGTENSLLQPGLPQRYQLKEFLGQGGMGKVFRAFDSVLDREVAIKVVSTGELDETTRARFFQEGKVLASLNHPNIVKILSSGFTESGLPYHVMEYLEGETLAGELQRGTLFPRRFHEIFSQVLSGLEHAHLHNLIHRDLKPTNIIIAPEGENGSQAKIIDFGIARVEAAGEERPALTRTGVLPGSPPYMSPEQCSGGEIDSRSDLYSLACIMYKCISGEPPFAGDNDLETMYKHVNEEAPKLSLLAVGKEDRRLAQLVDRCLLKKKEERIQTAQELKLELNEIFKSLPSMSFGSSVRKKAMLSAKVLAGCCLVALVPGLFWVGAKQHASSNKSWKAPAGESIQRAHLWDRANRNKQRIKFALKYLSNKSGQKEEAKISELAKDANDFGGATLQLFRLGDERVTAATLSQADKVLSSALAFQSASSGEFVTPLLKRAACRLEIGDFAGCKSDFTRALSTAAEIWGADSQSWLDAFFAVYSFSNSFKGLQWSECSYGQDLVPLAWKAD